MPATNFRQSRQMLPSQLLKECLYAAKDKNARALRLETLASPCRDDNCEVFHEHAGTGTPGHPASGELSASNATGQTQLCSCLPCQEPGSGTASTTMKRKRCAVHPLWDRSSVTNTRLVSQVAITCSLCSIGPMHFKSERQTGRGGIPQASRQRMLQITI